MGWIDNAKAILTRRKPEGMTAAYLSSTITTQEAAESRYALSYDAQQMVIRAVGEVWTALKYNSDQLAACPIRLYTTSSGKGKPVGKSVSAWLRKPIHGKASQYAHRGNIREVDDHDCLALLSNPNDPETGIEFLRAHWMLAQATGRMYWMHNATARNAPTELERLYPQWTHVDVDNDGVKSYTYSRNRTQFTTFEWESVIPFKWCPSLVNPFYGVGWIAAIGAECDSLAAAVMTSLNRWNNEGRPDFFIELPTGGGKDQQKQIEEMFRRTRGPSHAGKPMVIAGTGIKPTPMQWPAKDIQYLEEKSDLRHTIWRAAGIPSQLMEGKVGGLNASGEQQAQAKSFYIENTIMPAVSALCERLNESYLPLFGLKPGEYWLAPDNPMGEDQKAIEAQSLQDVDLAVRTVNEARALRQLEPIEGGDVLRYKGTTLDAKAEQAANPPKPNEPKPTEPDQKKSVSRSLYAKAMTVSGIGSLGCGCGHKKDATDTALPSVYDGTEEAQARLEQIMRDFYEAIDPATFDKREEAKKLRDELIVVLLLLFRDGYESGVTRLREAGFTGTIPPFADDAANATAFIDNYVPKLARTITQTVADTITTATADAHAEGLTPAETQVAVAEKVDLLKEVGPTRVADTETVRAFNYGTLDAWKLSDGVEYVEWFTQEDERVCPFCYELHGKTKPVGQAWFELGETATGELPDGSTQTLTFDYMPVYAPPVHPACRCEVYPVLKEEP